MGLNNPINSSDYLKKQRIENEESKKKSEGSYDFYSLHKLVKRQ